MEVRLKTKRSEHQQNILRNANQILEAGRNLAQYNKEASSFCDKKLAVKRFSARSYSKGSHEEIAKYKY